LSHLGWLIFLSGDFSLFTEAEIEEKELHNICWKKKMPSAAELMNVTNKDN